MAGRIAVEPPSVQGLERAKRDGYARPERARAVQATVPGLGARAATPKNRGNR